MGYQLSALSWHGRSAMPCPYRPPTSDYRRFLPTYRLTD